MSIVGGVFFESRQCVSKRASTGKHLWQRALADSLCHSPGCCLRSFEEIQENAGGNGSLEGMRWRDPAFSIGCAHTGSTFRSKGRALEKTTETSVDRARSSVFLPHFEHTVPEIRHRNLFRQHFPTAFCLFASIPMDHPDPTVVRGVLHSRMPREVGTALADNSSGGCRKV